MVLDGIADEKFGNTAVFRGISSRIAAFKKSSGPFTSLEGELEGISFVLVKPVTYMNESGRAITSLMTRGIIKHLDELLVVMDDVDLETGCVRLREKGSAGSHNGLRSIVSALGTGDFARLRIGVGPRPEGGEMVDYVLGSFRPEEIEPLNYSLNIASKCIESWIAGGMARARDELSIVGRRSINN